MADRGDNRAQRSDRLPVLSFLGRPGPDASTGTGGFLSAVIAGSLILVLAKDKACSNLVALRQQSLRRRYHAIEKTWRAASSRSAVAMAGCDPANAVMGSA